MCMCARVHGRRPLEASKRAAANRLNENVGERENRLNEKFGPKRVSGFAGVDFDLPGYFRLTILNFHDNNFPPGSWFVDQHRV